MHGSTPTQKTSRQCTQYSMTGTVLTTSIDWRHEVSGTSSYEPPSVDNPLNLDLRARAELLAYLVVSHLLARQMTGEWLSVEHLVESTTLWLKTNGGGADVMQRVMLSTRALDIARCLEQTLGLAVAPGSVTALFCENLRLEFRSPVARDIYQHCLTHLVDSGCF